MLIRVRSELGTFRADGLEDDTARAVDVVRCLRKTQATVLQPGTSLDLFFDPKCTKPVDNLQTLKEQHVSHGMMLFGKLSPQWQCATCTFLNAGQNNSDSVCEVCETPAFATELASKRPREDTSQSPKTSAPSRKKTAVPSRVPVGGFLAPRADESIDEFLEVARPSQVSNRDCAWITVHNQVPQSPGYQWSSGSGFSAEFYQPALSKIQEMIGRGQKVKAVDKKACVDEILQIAVSRGETVGKWMLFMSRDKVDDAWERIARATVEGRLGCSAKVAPSKELGEQCRALICIYVADFSNKKEVERVLRGIIALDFFVTSGFKPDVFTHLGIGSGNQWRLDSTIYKPKDVLDNWDV